jgi:hypothetical protein
VVLTKDKAIRRKSWEREKVIASGVQMFTLRSGTMTGEEMARVFLEIRLRVARLMLRQPGAFVALVSRSEVTLL